MEVALGYNILVTTTVPAVGGGSGEVLQHRGAERE
jgi:hypothetical protein